jgi:type I restriction-modification system DNA methylase subunit
MSLIKSKKRVADHGEVFTPPWIVEAMLDLVKGETERIDSRFLEPACGSGNFLVRVLQRKLGAVELKFGKSEFEKQQYALLALMCIYGIELLADNIAECRANLLEIFADSEPQWIGRFVPRGVLRAVAERRARRRADDAHA